MSFEATESMPQRRPVSASLVVGQVRVGRIQSRLSVYLVSLNGIDRR
jgi:hypothetical protein